MVDPISDMLTRVRNASRAKKLDVVIPHSRMKEAIAEILAREGFVARVTRTQRKEKNNDRTGSYLKIVLKYGTDQSPVIRDMRRVSKPGNRVYVGKEDIPRILGGMGIAILSTSQGIMTGREARSGGVGGELLCTIS